MSGWSTQVAGEYVPPKGVIAVVVAQGFDEPEIIRTTLEQGFERVAPDTVWVMREKPRANHAVGFAWQTFRSHGMEPLLAPLVPAWKLAESDLRAGWRDAEIRATCERVIVFHDKGSHVTEEWMGYRENSLSTAKIYVVERGKVKAKKRRKGRNPQV